MESIKFTGKLHIQLFDQFGNLSDERFITNSVTSAGKAGIIDQLLNVPTLRKLGWMAVGTSQPTPLLLGNEIARVSLSSKTRQGAVLSISAIFPAGIGTGAWTEAGTFDVVTPKGENMWMYTKFDVVNKGASDMITINWDLTVS
jgi:hypothetical protein